MKRARTLRKTRIIAAAIPFICMMFALIAGAFTAKAEDYTYTVRIFAGNQGKITCLI